MEYPAFIGGSYESESPLVDCERTINWYVEKTESGGATKQKALYPVPGVTQMKLDEEANPAVSFGNDVAAAMRVGPGRGHFFENGHEFVVLKDVFFELMPSGTVLRAAGKVLNDGLPATISSNGDGGGQILVCSGGNAYIYAAGALTEVTALRGKASMGAYLDGRFLVLDSATSTLYLSALLDGATWSTGTLYAQRTAGSDPWRSMIIVGKYIWLLGEKTSEAWYNAGTAPFPLSTVPQGFIEAGILGRFTARAIGQAIYWLGEGPAGIPSVMRMSGSTPEVISTYPMSELIRGYGKYDQVTADIQADRGHTFYILNFPGAISWAYDLSTGIWCERGLWYQGAWDASPMVNTVEAFGELRALSTKSGGVYRIDPKSSYWPSGRPIDPKSAITDEDVERPIRRLRRAPAIENENKRVYYSELELAIEPGLGNTVDPGSDPHVMMRMSNDAGKTWGPERWRSAGKRGEYGHSIQWHRLGSAKRRVFEVSTTNVIPWRVTAAYLTVGNQGG